jgi:tetratricopeptide (TPR) repeat protein
MMNKNIQTETGDRLAELAARYDQAGAPATAARFYRMAGEQAMAEYATDQALTYLSRALELTSDADVNERYALLLAREQVFAWRAEGEAQAQDLASLETVANCLKDDHKRAEVGVRRAQHKLVSGDTQGALTIVQLATRLAELAQAEPVKAEGYLTWGQVLLRRGQYQAARVQLKLALGQAQAAGLPQLEADSLRSLGVLRVDQGDFSQARLRYLEALPIYKQLRDRRGESNVLNNLGSIAHAQADFAAAQSYWTQAGEVYAQIGDRTGQSKTLNNLGTLQLDLGDYPQAQTYHQEVLTISRQIGLRFGECLALINLALAHHYQDDHQAAQVHSQEALRGAEEMGNRRLQGYALNVLGHALTGLDQLPAAADAYWRSLALWNELEVPNLALESRAGLGGVALRQGQTCQARDHIAAILSLLESGDPLEGTEAPFRIYLTCYRILEANQDPRAEIILQTAARLVQARAANINPPELRCSFLENVAAHRQIMSESNRRR